MGIKIEIVQIYLKDNWYKQNEIIQLNKHTHVVIKTEPILKNNKWYHKLINFISFNKLYGSYYIYEIEQINK